MPYESHKDLLDRNLSIVAAKNLINLASPLLQEIVNYSTHAFIRCMHPSTSAKEELEENLNLAAFALFRQLMELTDGIEIMISNSSPNVATPLLRSSFEALLSLEYILEDRETYRQRSFAWLINHVETKRKTYESLLPNSQRGKQFKASVAADKMVSDLGELPQPKSVENAIRNLDDFLSREQFRKVMEERKIVSRRAKWYSLFKGPGNLEELARYLNRPAQYDILYRSMSRYVHSQDFSNFITKTSDGKPGILGLRNAKNIPSTAIFSSNFLIDGCRQMIEHFHPGEAWGNWYNREVREKLHQLTHLMTT